MRIGDFLLFPTTNFLAEIISFNETHISMKSIGSRHPMVLIKSILSDDRIVLTKEEAVLHLLKCPQ